MSDDTPFTGVLTFPDPRDPHRKQFGMVAGTRPESGEGVLTVILRLRDTGIAWATDDSSVRLDIPAELARVALPIIAEALDRLDATGNREQ